MILKHEIEWQGKMLDRSLFDVLEVIWKENVLPSKKFDIKENINNAKKTLNEAWQQKGIDPFIAYAKHKSLQHMLSIIVQHRCNFCPTISDHLWHVPYLAWRILLHQILLAHYSFLTLWPCSLDRPIANYQALHVILWVVYRLH